VLSDVCVWGFQSGVGVQLTGHWRLETLQDGAACFFQKVGSKKPAGGAKSSGMAWHGMAWLAMFEYPLS